ncbi:peptidylprolyl isomerase [Chloroflexota bacterium]
MKNSNIIFILILLLGALWVSGCDIVPSLAQVKNGDTIQVHYTGKLADGTIFDSSIEREPLEFTLGEGRLIPGFEKAVLGMKVGEKKIVTIPANEAYGPYLNELIAELPRQDLPSDLVPQVGQQLQSNQADGSPIRVVITEVSDTTVTVDGNHPLAGKDLIFEIELVKIL